MCSVTAISDPIKLAKAEYDKHGYAILRNVLDSDLMTEVSAHVEWLSQKYPHIDPELLEHDLMRDDPFWLKLVSHPNLVKIAQEFLGPNVATFASHYVCKLPLKGRQIHWHQDGSYWPLEPMNVVSIWLAVDSSTPDNGCVQFLPGSHKQGLITKGLNSNDFASHVKEVHQGKGEDFFSNIDVSQMVDACLNVGDVSLHHPYTVHGSRANTSEKRRCGLTIRYIATSTKVLLDGLDPFTTTTKGSPFLCEGCKPDPEVNNFFFPKPKYEAGKHFSFKGCNDVV